MAEQELKFDKSGLDTWTEETTFEVTRERVIEYTKATNDPIAAHLAGTRPTRCSRSCRCSSR